MKAGLLLGCDDQVAAKQFAALNTTPIKFDQCIGLIDEDKNLGGSIFFHNWNGHNIELSYYGENTLSPGIIRCLARFCICTFNVSRLTVIVSKRRRRLMRSLQRFGFKLEGHQRCYYGKKDCPRNTGIRFVLFRDRLEQLARLDATARAAQAC